MKTKIIYISGSEIFKASDVRDAFDTVRSQLGLSQDTVLFGVPVDADDALAGQFDSVTAIHPEPIVTETLTQKETLEQQEKPKRTKRKVADLEPKNIPVAEDNSEKEIIPILSVLGGDAQTGIQSKSDNVEDENCTNDVDVVDEVSQDDNDDNDKNVVSGIQNLTIETDVIDTEADQDIIKQEISCLDSHDIDLDDSDVEPEINISQDSDEDNQLEKLLQSVQSLHEEKNEDTAELAVPDTEPDETDLTLEKLATEFAENQDKIVNTTKTSSRGGKIGKLKNILPFKKAKRNDSGLMGDLFGWAGVAANDEEFGIPEFFPTAMKK